jgi:hypothetical protein
VFKYRYLIIVYHALLFHWHLTLLSCFSNLISDILETKYSLKEKICHTIMSRFEWKIPIPVISTIFTVDNEGSFPKYGIPRSWRNEKQKMSSLKMSSVIENCRGARACWLIAAVECAPISVYKAAIRGYGTVQFYVLR